MAVLAATTVQIGENLIGVLITAIVVPLAGALWREREKRLNAERDRDRYKERVEGIGGDSDGLKADVRLLRQEVADLRRGRGAAPDAGRSPSRGAELFPYHSRSSRVRRPTSSRSTGRSRGSGRGSGGSSGSGTGSRT